MFWDRRAARLVMVKARTSNIIKMTIKVCCDLNIQGDGFGTRYYN